MKASQRGLGWAAPLIAGFLLAVLLYRVFSAPPQIQLKVTGAAGVRISGTCTADGKLVRFGPSRVPNTIGAAGRTITYRIENVGTAGAMTVEVIVDGESQGTVTARGAHNVVRGTVENGRVAQTSMPANTDN